MKTISFAGVHIAFINLNNAASGVFNISIFGLDWFKKSRRLAITVWNCRVVVWFREQKP